MTETSAPLPMSLAQLVGAGKSAADIAKTLSLSEDEVRERLKKTGLLGIVEPESTKTAPPAAKEEKPVPATDTTPTTPSNGATMDPHNAAPKRVRKPRAAKPVKAAAKPRAKAPTKRRGRPTNAEVAARLDATNREKDGAVRAAYGTLYLAAQKSGISIDELIAAAKVVGTN